MVEEVYDEACDAEKTERRQEAPHGLHRSGKMGDGLVLGVVELVGDRSHFRPSVHGACRATRLGISNACASQDGAAGPSSIRLRADSGPRPREPPRSRSRARGGRRMSRLVLHGARRPLTRGGAAPETAATSTFLL